MVQQHVRIQGDEGLDVYVGLKEIIFAFNGTEAGYKWADSSCVNSYCDDCKVRFTLFIHTW
jgi:hypothetical protein